MYKNDVKCSFGDLTKIFKLEENCIDNNNNYYNNNNSFNSYFIIL